MCSYAYSGLVPLLSHDSMVWDSSRCSERVLFGICCFHIHTSGFRFVAFCVVERQLVYLVMIDQLNVYIC